MEEFNKKEYQTVILAALLHDIGKFLQRMDGNTYKTSHEETSALFVEAFRKKLQNDNLYDAELIKFLLRFHHKDEKKEKILQSDYCKDLKIDQENAWSLLSIVNRADNYSCVEREKNKDEKRKGFAERRAALDSIFSRINIDDKKRDNNISAHYMINELDPYTSFPEKSLELLTDDILSSRIESFKERLPDFSELNAFSDVLNIWIDYLQVFLWSVPSDTRYLHSDVSLFDHLRTSAAIAACLYKYHHHNLGKPTNLRKENEFYFVGGDFSGIQKYIFDITSAGGAAKRLRARSAFVFMFCEATIHKILDALDLPYVCNLFSSGGKFLILAPYTKDTETQLEKVKAEIEAEIHRTYFNRFSFLMAWQPIQRYENDFEVYEFYKCANDMFWHLEREKLNKSATVFIDRDGHWAEESFRATTLYRLYKGEGDCKICGKGPAIRPNTPGDTDGPVQCEHCHSDRNVIGQNIPKCRAVAFGSVPDGTQKPKNGITLFHGDPEYFAELIKQEDAVAADENHYLVYHFQKGAGNDGKGVTRYYTNHVPMDNKGNTLEFTHIAAFPTVIDNEESGSTGMMGMLKADIDNLGLIFNKGFENPGDDEKDISPPDRKSISRFLTLSRMTELFFSGWVQASMEEKNHEANINALESVNGITEKDLWSTYLQSCVVDFTKIYTVYSGGDDLVLIGPWETMIVYAVLLNMRFREFTCHNPSVTLSAGLACVKPKYPAASGIALAEALLDTSKEMGKNRISLFGTTVEWEQLPRLIDYFLFIDSKLKERDPGINKGFLYRLLEYHNMALDYFNEAKPEGLKFISALNYDLGRNIVKWKDGKIIKGKQDLNWLIRLEDIDTNKAIMKNIKIPLFWALYRARQEK